ncbi:MAG TPA: 30S ribosomal protein S9 [Chitinophagales bacterium]|nr:30S ribosomal protein S9 [Chitinophagales bacterium]
MSAENMTVGRRKAAVARVLLQKGTGNITVNGKDYKEYFPMLHLRERVEQPLALVESNEYDLRVNVNGGGIKGQADAVKLAIARVFVKVNPENRPKLKAASLLTRDAREVERKKAGLRKARKRSQFSKR